MAGFTLTAVDEWLAHDPFGAPNPSDASDARGPALSDEGAVTLRGARNGYVSFRLLVQGAGDYRLAGSVDGLEVDLYRAWYHRMHTEEGEEPEYWPDALVPLDPDAACELPDPDNQVEGQTAQEFWVDVFIPPDAETGEATGEITLSANGGTTSLPVAVTVLDATLPDEPCVVMDHNSYGCRFLRRFFPETLGGLEGDALWRKSIELLQHYHRLVYEHRGLLSNLGYGHSGAYDPIYAPAPEGRGREKRLGDWGLYDAHYGPLLDGSAFETAAPGCPGPRRPARPIWGIYAPLNPAYPADYLYWGQKGYEVEFTRCVGQFDRHFRDQGWTESKVAFYLNHKKRYRWFGWDGDEVKFLKDMDYQNEMVRLWEEAVGDSPVPWVYRMDASWQMKNLFPMMEGHANFWVLGGFHRWYPDHVAEVVARGDITWWYNGTPPIGAASSAILSNCYETWMRRMGGNCAWLTTNPGPDPWFDSGGGDTGTIYPGERFGIPGPIPSVRLKIQRNGIQDLDLLEAACRADADKDAVQDEFASSIPIPIWTKPPRAAIELPPEDWNSRNLSEEHEPEHVERQALDPTWWTTVREKARAGG
ncbi:MAG: DUF4091 domain-containing protein [Planctomycetota bacterium]